MNKADFFIACSKYRSVEPLKDHKRNVGNYGKIPPSNIIYLIITLAIVTVAILKIVSIL